jgi:hypothetical protein
MGSREQEPLPPGGGEQDLEQAANRLQPWNTRVQQEDRVPLYDSPYSNAFALHSSGERLAAVSAAPRTPYIRGHHAVSSALVGLKTGNRHPRSLHPYPARTGTTALPPAVPSCPNGWHSP